MNYGREVVRMALDELGVDIPRDTDKEWVYVLCPLHEDVNTPSLAVNVDNGAWKCWGGCGSGSDLADLISRATDEKKEDVVRRLKQRIPLSVDSLLDALSSKRRDVVDSVGEPLFYDRHHFPRYILDRGFSKETLNKWGVGWDPNARAVVLPVRVDGRLVGLIRRLIDRDVRSKYLYTRGLQRSEILFGIEHVPKSAREIILVEGSLDAMWLDQFGYHAVAILGSSMSESQAKAVSKRFWKATLAFDNDKAGSFARDVAAERLKGLKLYTVRLPDDKKDVQDCDEAELTRLFSDKRPVWYNV